MQYVSEVVDTTGITVRSVDKSDLCYAEVSTWEQLERYRNEDPRIGDMYVKDGVPVGIILSIQYYRDPWRLMLEMQRYA